MLAVQEVKLDGTPHESNKMRQLKLLITTEGHNHFPNSTGNMDADSTGCDMQTNAASVWQHLGLSLF